MATITDLVKCKDNRRASEVLSASDYFDKLSATVHPPFGKQMAGRNYSDENYRYGFNGKENDKDFGNQHLIQDYGFRLYNPEIGKFLSVDPLAAGYPFYTPYQFTGNNPIAFIDLDGLEPVKPQLFWNNNPKIELALYGKDIEKTVIYQTVGIHSNDKFFQNAHKMYVAQKYGKSSENFYYYDNGLKSWVEFNPNSIGLNAEEATNFAVYSIGSAGVVVGGLVLLESGAVVKASEQLFITKGKDIAAKMSMDALNQYIMKGGDYEKIDWANVAASGLIKEKHLKNLIVSALDLTIEKGYHTKNIKGTTVEFVIRTAADALFDKYKRPNSEAWNEKMGTDLLKKAIRKMVKDILEEHLGKSETTPEN
ncbi:RHS repeat-associated core domain-containing protein [Rapidithrix thailandica]|uniref:RHS repeat-associated core domain-containing protein n=1 Tax=Rapidithrix thailandica TaxID=413964 RepID=A0AAW9S7Z8_9BACT